MKSDVLVARTSVLAASPGLDGRTRRNPKSTPSESFGQTLPIANKSSHSVLLINKLYQSPEDFFEIDQRERERIEEISRYKVGFRKVSICKRVEQISSNNCCWERARRADWRRPTERVSIADAEIQKRSEVARFFNKLFERHLKRSLQPTLGAR